METHHNSLESVQSPLSRPIQPRPGELYRLGHYRARVLECHGELCRVACEGGHLVSASVHVSLLQ